MLEKSSTKNFVAASAAAESLGASHTAINSKDLPEYYGEIKDVGRVMSAQSDMYLIRSLKHYDLESISKGATIPLINMGSNFQEPIAALAIAMTLQEKYNRLSNLKMTLVGSPTAIFHSMMCCLPRFSIDIKLACSKTPECQISPRFLKLSKDFCETAKAIIENCLHIDEAMEETQIVVINTGKIKCRNFILNLKDFETADPNWSLIHILPRAESTTDELFLHKNSLTFNAIENLKWIYMATMVRLMIPNYSHAIDAPKF